MKNTKDHETLTLEPTKSRLIRSKNQTFLLDKVSRHPSKLVIQGLKVVYC